MAFAMTNRQYYLYPKKPFTILVEGNIGSGKSLFLNHFKRYPSMKVFDEPIHAWRDCGGHNLLDLMYKDPEKWGFSLQSYIQLTMLEQHVKPIKEPIKFMERSIFSARHCFVEKLMKDGMLTQESAAVLDEWYKWIINNVDIPVDLVVYMRTSPEIVMQRIKERNRQEEKNITYDFIKDLHEIHDTWLCDTKTDTKKLPLVILDGNVDKNNMEQEFRKYDSYIMDCISTLS